MKRKTRKSVGPRFAAFCRKVGLAVPGRLPRANPPNLVVRRAAAYRHLMSGIGNRDRPDRVNDAH